MTMHVGFFVLALALMSVHELDAMLRHEWRIFPLTAFMEEETGMLVFLWLHVPVFALLFYFSASAIAVGGNAFSIGFSVFCVAHAFVHFLYERHPKCEFRNALSRSLIWSCAAAGFFAILLL
jgi:hypothetical protein